MTYSVDATHPRALAEDAPDYPVILLDTSSRTRYVSTAARRLLTLQCPDRWSEVRPCVVEALGKVLEALQEPMETARIFDLTVSLPQARQVFPCAIWKIAGQDEAFWLLLLLHEPLPTAASEDNLQAATRWRTFLKLLPGIIHSLRNPLNTMNINLLLLQEIVEAGGTATTVSAGSDPRHYVRVLQQEAERLGALLDSLFNELLSTTPRSRAADLSAVLRELATFIAPLTRRQSVAFNLQVPEQGVSFDDRHKYVGQAVLHVLVNRLEAIPPQGRLDLRLECANAQAMIMVEDNGPSTATAVNSSLFDQHAPSAADSGGTDGGLYVARRLIETCGGEIRLASGSEQGTRIEITLSGAELLSVTGS